MKKLRYALIVIALSMTGTAILADNANFQPVSLPASMLNREGIMDAPDDAEMAGIPWSLKTKGKHTAAMLLENDGQTITVPLKGAASHIHILHTFHPGDAMQPWREATLESIKTGGPRPELPVVMQYIVEYTDGTRLPVNVRWQEGIEAALRRTFLPVDRFIYDMAWARVAWQGEYSYERDDRNVVYAMTIPNPHPGKKLKSMAAVSMDYGDAEIYAVTLEKSPPAGDVFYVAPDGDDRGSGSWDKPWATLVHAAKTLKAGDTVYCREGDYRMSEIALVFNSGEDGKRIRFFNFPGERPRFNGWGIETEKKEYKNLNNGEAFDRVPGRIGILHISNRSYITVKGLYFFDAQNQGLTVERGSHHVDVLFNHFERAVGGNMSCTGSKDMRLEHCRVIGNRCLNAYDPKLIMATTGGGWQEHLRRRCGRGESFGAECLDMYRNNDFEVGHNEVSWGAKEGIDCLGFCYNGRVHHNYVHDIFVIPTFLGGKVGIYIDAWGEDQHHIEVDHNVVERAGSGINFHNEGRTPYRDMQCHHNLLVDNYWTGIEVGSVPDVQGGQVHNISVMNNTVYRNGFLDSNKGPAGGIHIGPSVCMSNLTVKNNIVAGNRDYPIATDSRMDRGAKRIIITHNLITPFTITADPARSDRHIGTFGGYPILAEPKFIDPENYNFNLLPDSPAIDAGDADPSYRDTDGTRADLGAFPYPQVFPDIPYCRDGISVDGDPADWKSISPLTAPGNPPQPDAVRICWNETGLYGLVTARDKDVNFTIFDAGRGVGGGIINKNDVLTLGIQRDGEETELYNEHSYLQYIAPDPEAGGKAMVFGKPEWKFFRQKFHKFRKLKDKRVQAALVKVKDGYVIEFYIPAESLEPLEMKPGTSFPMFYNLRDRKNVLAEFVKLKNVGTRHREQPAAWQRVKLAK